MYNLAKTHYNEELNYALFNINANVGVIEGEYRYDKD